MIDRIVEYVFGGLLVLFVLFTVLLIAAGPALREREKKQVADCNATGGLYISDVCQHPVRTIP